MSRARSLWWLVLACCCHPNPSIKTFHVTPSAYCPAGKQTIHVDWSTAKGKTTLQVEPDDREPRSVPPTGTREFPAHDAVVSIWVRDGALAPHVIQPVRAVRPRPLNAEAKHCQHGWVWSDAEDFGGGPEAFAAGVYPAVISNKCSPSASATATCRRHVKVEHANKSWEIAPDSTAVVGDESVTMTGPWVLKQELISGEDCMTQSAKTALGIDLIVEAGCTKGAVYEQ